MTSLRGKLLIASPALVDPNFARSVVLIAEHTEDGAMGLVLNRPSDAEVDVAVGELGGGDQIREVGLRLAELYSREGMVAQAVEHFRLAADRLHQVGAGPRLR